MKKRHLLILSIAIIALISGSFFFWLKINSQAVSNNKASVFLEIKQGMTFSKILTSLYEKRIIRSPLAAKYLWWLKRYQLKTGYYQLSADMDLNEILDILGRGKIYLIKVTFPEGFNFYKIPQLLDGHQLQDISQDFIKAVKDKRLLSKYNIPFETAEGYLFPSTYHVPKNITGYEMVEKMITTFLKKVGKDWSIYSPAKQKEILIMASIIEKEAAAEEERSTIASVFYNRLKKNMAFESCATVIYSFEQIGVHKKRLLYRDLNITSPFNTYRHKGLPPSPIANPGLNSIMAAIHPDSTEYLYFVYKGNGRHIFSKTSKEHMDAYRKYILYQNTRKK